MKLTVISAATLLSSACAITEMVALTGLSYALTGKSVSDNALSMVTNMDCAAHHMLDGDAICQSKTQSLADNAFLAFAPMDELTYESPSLPVQFKDRPSDLNFDAAGKDQRDVGVNAEVSTVPEVKQDIFAVVGSFKDVQNAKVRKRQFDGYSARISTTVTKDQTLHRVVIGPLSHRDEMAQFPAYMTSEKTNPWIISRCNSDISAPSCVAFSDAKQG